MHLQVAYNDAFRMIYGLPHHTSACVWQFFLLYLPLTLLYVSRSTLLLNAAVHQLIFGSMR